VASMTTTVKNHEVRLKSAYRSICRCHGNHSLGLEPRPAPHINESRFTVFNVFCPSHDPVLQLRLASRDERVVLNRTAEGTVRFLSREDNDFAVATMQQP
jgi:hypothetical protein